MVEAKHKWKAWIYLLPSLVLLGLFTVYPIINTTLLAFREGYDAMGILGGETFTWGFQNFKDVIEFRYFNTALKNTILLCVITVPLSTVLALLIAVVLNSIKPFRRLLQTIYFLPYVTNSIAIGMVFAAMFNRITFIGANGETIIMSAGIMNNILGLFGIDPINWMNAGSTPLANMVVMVVYIVWNALPFKILILLGGLQSVNKQYYDAAKVDGTSKFRTLIRITVPMLSPMLAYVIITGFIGGFKEYTSIVGVFGDQMGPIGGRFQMGTIVGLINRYMGVGSAGSANAQYGIASAAALILFAIILLVTIINLYVSKKKVHY